MQVQFQENGKIKRGLLSRTSNAKHNYSMLSLEMMVAAFARQDAKSWDVRFDIGVGDWIKDKYGLNARTMILRDVKSKTDTGFETVVDRGVELRKIAFDLYKQGFYVV